VTGKKEGNRKDGDEKKLKFFLSSDFYKAQIIH
jgi:hypothetical protein